MNNTDDEKSLERAQSGEDNGQPMSAETEKSDPDYLKISVINSEDFGYIIPDETYKQHHRKHRHHHHHHRHHSSSQASTAETGDTTEDYVFPEKRRRSKRSKWRRMAWWKKTLIIILSILLVLVIVFGSAFFIMREIGRSRMHNYDAIEIVPPTEQEIVMDIDNNGRVIHYDGKSYILNENLVGITFIGADDSTVDDEYRRMADAIYMLTVDTVTGAVKVLGVSRDTMTDVNRYSVEGRFIDTTREQISYSYSYGNDTVKGGQNTNASLSKLFFGLPMQNYFAINLDALYDLNEAVGGVTLTSSITFESPEDGRTISEGEAVTLHGKEAERYIRTRDTSKLDSNNTRMERQQQYIRAFLSSIVPAVKKDISTIGSLYNVVKANSDSNLNLTDITYLASSVLPKLSGASQIEYVTLKGNLTAGEHPEMNVTNDQAIRTMLDVFYLPYS